MAAYTSVENAGNAPLMIDPIGPTRVISNSHKFAVRSMLTADTLTVIPINAGDYVHSVFVKVKTVEGTVMALSIGDSASPTTWHATFDANALTNILCTALAAGKLYTAADAIRIGVVTAAATVDVAEVEVVAIITRVF